MYRLANFSESRTNAIVFLRTAICVVCALGAGLLSVETAVARENLTREIILLWSGVAPGSESFDGEEKTEERGDPEVPNAWVTQVKQPRMEVIPATTKEVAHTAIVICPGGGYGGLAYDKEGVEIGLWFAKRGVTAFVLKYRHGGGVHQHPVPLSDAQRALRIVRSQAKERGYGADRVGVMGFSAGGHLASTASTHFDDGDPGAAEVVDRWSCRPDFQVLIYPVISMDEAITHAGSRTNLLGKHPSPEDVENLSNELQVTEETPPAFIVHATDDGAVPVVNSVRYYLALVKHKVAAELHIFEKGGHGFGKRRKDLPAVEWPHLLENWLRNRQLIR